MQKKFFDHLVLFLLSISIGSFIGCGKSSNGTVVTSGTVTFDGQSIPTGVIVFMPVNDPKLTGDSGKIKDGKFSFGVKPGKKRIEIHATKEGKLDPDMGRPDQIPYIPEKYNLKSTLEKEISATGKNEFEFKLTK
jgi:hypothetical protein